MLFFSSYRLKTSWNTRRRSPSWHVSQPSVCRLCARWRCWWPRWPCWGSLRTTAAPGRSTGSGLCTGPTPASGRRKTSGPRRPTRATRATSHASATPPLTVSEARRGGNVLRYASEATSKKEKEKKKKRVMNHQGFDKLFGSPKRLLRR